MILGLGMILLTTVVMGLGSIGTQPLAQWNAMITADAGDAPHLMVGGAMFGEAGRTLMAVASVAATWSTLLIALAAVPRMIFAVARDGLWFGPLSGYFAQVHPRTGVPVRATLLVVAIYLAVTLCSGAVVECLYAAAYLWFFRYLVILVLAGANRLRSRRAPGLLGPRTLAVGVPTGIALIGLAWQQGFAGVHTVYGSRALVLLAVALVATAVAWALQVRKRDAQRTGAAVRMPTRSSLNSGNGRRVSPPALVTGVVAMLRPVLGSTHATIPARAGQFVRVTAAPETSGGL
jgi:amino acid transporter